MRVHSLNKVRFGLFIECREMDRNKSLKRYSGEKDKHYSQGRGGKLQKSFNQTVD